MGVSSCLRLGWTELQVVLSGFLHDDTSFNSPYLQPPKQSDWHLPTMGTREGQPTLVRRSFRLDIEHIARDRGSLRL